LYQYKGQYNYI